MLIFWSAAVCCEAQATTIVEDFEGYRPGYRFPRDRDPQGVKLGCGWVLEQPDIFKGTAKTAALNRPGGQGKTCLSLTGSPCLLMSRGGIETLLGNHYRFGIWAMGKGTVKLNIYEYGPPGWSGSCTKSFEVGSQWKQLVFEYRAGHSPYEGGAETVRPNIKPTGVLTIKATGEVFIDDISYTRVEGNPPAREAEPEAVAGPEVRLPFAKPSVLILAGLYYQNYGALKFADLIDAAKVEKGYYNPIIFTADSVEKVPNSDEEALAYDTYVLCNVDAQTLGADAAKRISHAVNQGARLVVMGDFYAFGNGGYAGSEFERRLLPVESRGPFQIIESAKPLSVRPAARLTGLAGRPALGRDASGLLVSQHQVGQTWGGTARHRRGQAADSGLEAWEGRCGGRSRHGAWGPHSGGRILEVGWLARPARCVPQGPCAMSLLALGPDGKSTPTQAPSRSGGSAIRPDTDLLEELL